MRSSFDRRRFLSLLGFSTLSGAFSMLGGCGGGSGSKSTGNDTPSVPGDIQFRITWPTSGLLAAAQSLVISNNISVPLTDKRFAKRTAETAETLHRSLNEGIQTFSLTLFSEADGSGTVLYQMYFAARIEQGRQVQQEIVFGDSYRSLDISGGFSELPLNASDPVLLTGQFVATLRDTQDRIVLMPSDRFAWSSSNPSTVYVLSQGQAFRRQDGSVRITVRDTAIGRSAFKQIASANNPFPSNLIPLSGNLGRTALTANQELWCGGSTYRSLVDTVMAFDINTNTITRSVTLPGPIEKLAASGDGLGVFIVHARSFVDPGVSWHETQPFPGLALSFLDTTTYTLQHLADLLPYITTVQHLAPAPGASRRIAIGASGGSNLAPWQSPNVSLYERGMLVRDTSPGELSVVAMAWGEDDQYLYLIRGVTLAVQRYRVTSRDFSSDDYYDSTRLTGAERWIFADHSRILVDRDLYDRETHALLRTLPAPEIPSDAVAPSLRAIEGSDLASNRITALFVEGALGNTYRLLSYNVSSGAILDSQSGDLNFGDAELISLPSSRIGLISAGWIKILDHVPGVG